MANVIGLTTNVDGVFYAKSDDGSIREISHGDELYEGESIMGSEINNPKDSVLISLYDGSDIIISGQESQILDNSLFAEEFSEDETITQADSLGDIVEDYEGEDIDEIETAAGDETAAVGSSEGGEAIFAEHNNASADINADLRDRGYGVDEDTVDAVPEDTIYSSVITPAIDEQTVDEVVNSDFRPETTVFSLEILSERAEETEPESTVAAAPEETTPEETVEAIPESTTVAGSYDEDTTSENTIPEDTKEAVAEDTTPGVAAKAEETIPAGGEQTTDATPESTTIATDESTTAAVEAAAESTKPAVEGVAEDTTPAVEAKAEETIPAGGEQTTDATPESTVAATDESTTPAVEAVAEDTTPESTTDASDEQTTPENTTPAIPESTVNNPGANNGFGNGDQDAPGKSNLKNNAENAGGDGSSGSGGGGENTTPAIPESTVDENTVAATSEQTVDESTTAAVDAVAEDTTPAADEQTTNAAPESTVTATSESTTPATEAVAEDTTPVVEAVPEDTTPAVEAVDEDTTPAGEEQTTDAAPESTTTATDELTTPAVEAVEGVVNVEARDEQTTDENTIDGETAVNITGENIDLDSVIGKVEGIDSINLGEGSQNISSLSLEDVLTMTESDKLLRIDGESGDSLDLNTQGDDAEWTLGEFKTDAETGQIYQEYTSGEGDSTVTIEVNTDIDVQEI